MKNIKIPIYLMKTLIHNYIKILNLNLNIYNFARILKHHKQENSYFYLVNSFIVKVKIIQCVTKNVFDLWRF